nr:RNA-directed DNA polymerase, eukaryota, reverse transcriptase zinc-binding domain protein [Tanacetum cinerariifolium]
TPSEPVDSLSMGDEHLNTIPATKSDEFKKSCVENLVSNPSESEGENECDVPAGFTTFSNVLFDADYDFDSESMPNHDSSIIISLKIDSLFDEFAGELTLLKSIPPEIDETNCHPEEEICLTKRLLYDNSSPRPPEKFVSANSNADIESFSPSPIPIKDSDSRMEEIDLSVTLDDLMPPGIKDDDYDSGRDILILEELLEIIPFHSLPMSHTILIFPHLIVFHLALGLKINIHKSNIYGIGVSDVDVSFMASNSGCASRTFPFTYLGLLIGYNMILTSSWHVLLNRFQL